VDDVESVGLLTIQTTKFTKRSKLFLGLTTCCLAIAGAVAAKVTHFGIQSGAYFTTGSHCVFGFGVFPCSKAAGMLKTCVYTYTPHLLSKETAVYTISGFCTTLLKYSSD